MIARLSEFVDRAKRLGPTLMALRPVRAAIRYNELRGNRLAGAVSFYGIYLVTRLLMGLAAATAEWGQDHSDAEPAQVA